jgi:fatty-acyl-CoA synthase
MNRFIAAIDRQIRDRPDEIFCHFVRGDEAWPISWAALGRHSGGFSAHFRAHGVATGSIVAIFLRHDPAIYAALFGAMANGLVPTILPCPSPRQDPGIYWDSLRHLLAHLDPAAIVLDRRSLAEAHAAGLTLAMSRAILAEDVSREGEWSPHRAAADGLALLQHSSGTTGRQKSIALTWSALVAQLESYGAALCLDAADRIVSWLPLYHDMGLVACLLLPAYFGVPFVHLDAFEWVARPEMLLAAIEDYRGTLVWQPDFAFAHLAGNVRGESPCDLSSMRAFINCAEPCRAESFARFLRRFAASGVTAEMLQSCYGMAESVFCVSQTMLGSPPRSVMIGDPPRRVMNLGRPVAGIEISIRGPDFARRGDGVVGEIALRGEFLLQGYFGDPGLTADRMRAGWYLTRDLGCIIAGELHVVGRRDDMLIVNGRNLHAGDIEARIGMLGLTRPGRAAAFALYDPRRGGNGFVIVAERAPDCALGEDEIVGRISAHLRAALDTQPWDVRLVPTGTIVKTTSGKISRGGNKQKYLAAMARQRMGAAFAGA